MRFLTVAEKAKRGCAYCTDMEYKYSTRSSGIRITCPHAECAYKVLDKYDTYEDFMKSKDSKINIGALYDAEWTAGRATVAVMQYFPVVRRFGKDGLF